MENFELAGERDGVSRYTMRSNGMEILLREDHAAPVVSFLVLYRVGSRNEAVGYTGSTHMLEHMMFKGTPEMNRERGTQIAALLERVGADFNATTWYDRTNYFETVPSDQLELAIRIEADRMRNAYVADEDRQSEMTVVRNELERGENDPANVLDIQSHATAFREHPYHHPTIGWHSDVEGVPTDRLKEFYDTFYWPDNATVIVAGDFDTDEALALVDRHFGPIPRAPHVLPGVYTREPDQQGERRFVIRRAGSDGIVALNFRTPEAAHPDTAVLAVVQTLLGTGRSSRLYRALVDSQLASDVMVGAEEFRDPGIFQVYAYVTPGVSHTTVERAVLDELQRLRNEPVPDAEVEKAKRIVRTRTIFAREGATNCGYELSEAVSSVDWNWFFDFPEAVDRVTAEDITRVARTYFRRSQLTAGWFVPTRIVDDEDDLSTHDEPEPGDPVEGPSVWSESGSLDADEAPIDATPPRAPTRPLPPLGATRTHRAEARSFAERVVRVELESGAVVVLLEHQADPTVAMRAQVRAGSYFSPENRVLADVTARMLRRGTARRSALRFAEDVESLGAQIGASAGAFSVDVRGHALAQDAEEILAAMAEMLREPAFPAVELDKVKAEIAAEIRQQQDSTSARAFERFTQLVLPVEHPYYDPPAAESLAELERITTDNVRRFYEAHYNGAALTLAVVGGVDPARIVDAARHLFGDWAGSRPAEIRVERTMPREARRETVLMEDKANADVVLGLPGTLARHDPDFLAALVGNAALGQSTLSSRLGLRVRDREGLTYGIASRFYGASLVDGLWLAHVTVQPANIEQAIASTVDELSRALRDGITDDEVAAYKSNFTGTFKVGLATNAGIAARLVEAEFFGFGPGYLDDYPRLVAAVSTADVNAALRRHVDLERLTIVIAGEVEE
jgi:zinc protease